MRPKTELKAAAIEGRKKKKEFTEGEGFRQKKVTVESQGKEKEKIKSMERRPDGSYMTEEYKSKQYKGSPEKSTVVRKEKIYDQNMNKIGKTVYRRKGDQEMLKEVKYKDGKRSVNKDAFRSMAARALVNKNPTA